MTSTGTVPDPAKYSFDEECLALAEYFYPKASDKQLFDLAQEIQDVVESHFDELFDEERT